MVLDAYNKGELKPVGATKRSVKLSGEELINAINKLRDELISKKEATEIFGQEKNKGNVEGIVGNVMQSFGGKPVYATAEEKVAKYWGHVLYLKANG